jgi:hypothetical protein
MFYQDGAAGLGRKSLAHGIEARQSESFVAHVVEQDFEAVVGELSVQEPVGRQKNEVQHELKMPNVMESATF